MRSHARVEFDTPLPPERVMAALTDFSAERTEVWRGLDPGKYAVYELDKTSAVVREGNRRPNIWARECYDWSTPFRVSWETEESNAFAPGSCIELVVDPGPGGGSHVRMHGGRVAATPIGYLTVLLLKLAGKRYLISNYKGTFDRLAREGSPRSTPAGDAKSR